MPPPLPPRVKLGRMMAGKPVSLSRSRASRHVVGEAAAAGLQAQVVHEGLEELAVLAAVDGLGLGADEHDARALQQPALVGLHGEVQGRLAAHRGQDGVGLLGLDDLLQHRQGEGLDVGGVRPARVRHDRGRVGVQQDRADALLPQGLQRLRPRVVELAGLADLDGPGAQHQHALQIRPLRHGGTPGACAHKAPKAGCASWGPGEASG